MREDYNTIHLIAMVVFGIGIGMFISLLMMLYSGCAC